MLSLGTVNGPQRGIYRVWGRDAVPPLMEESCVAAAEFFEQLAYSGFKSRGFCIYEVRRLPVNQCEPRPVILIWVADIDVSLGNEFLDAAHDFGAILRFGEMV